MRIIKCYIENFGLFHTTEFEFSKGLNCCVSENGTGKTTLTAFIEAMLYGIGDTRKQSLDDNPRKKYMPWQGGRFGGSLTVEANKKRYVIERSFGARPADDTFRLVDADSGRVCAEHEDNIGESLFGIDRDGFLRTVFLSEKNLQGKNENKSISAKLSDLVGVDGDVGEFDDALKLLEERRKFYFKKGNTGEIANVKERINEAQRRIDNVTRLEDEVKNGEGRLRILRSEKSKLLALDSEQRSKLDAIKRQRDRSANEQTYIAMRAEVEKEVKRLDEVKSFFKNGVPTAIEIDASRDTYNESKRLRAEAMTERGNEEFASLGEFFKNSTDFVEIAEVERAAELAENNTRELQAIDNLADPRSIKMRSLFRSEPPTKEALERAKNMRRGGKGFKKAIFTLIGILMAAIGAIIGGTVGYIASAVGIIVAIVSAILIKKPSKSKELLSFIREYSDCECGCIDKSLADIEAKLTEYNTLSIERSQRREELSDEISELTMTVYSFLGKFPIVDADSPLDSVRQIKHNYAKFYTLGQEGSSKESNKLSKLQRSDELAKSAESFLSRFPTVSPSPFDEIRSRLNEYTYLSASVARLERECDVFAVRHGVTGKITEGELDKETAINGAIREITEKIRVLTEEETLLERELNLARAEIEKKDEYQMSKDELDELYRKHVDSLDVIKKTSFYLKEACDNITSKYLGKTKEKFEEYSSLIAGIDGEYALNTSFELSRTERGESHGIESYSRGTRDLYALGLRLALVDALYEKETPFIILDDPFVALDDAKLERAKTMLKSLGKTKQILYFTCAKSRAIE